MNLRFQKNIFDMFMESQYWPLDIMRDYQRTQLAQLLRHAKERPVFYKTRLDPIFTKTGDIDWEHSARNPIVTRADLRDRREEMLTTALPPGHGPSKTFHSSGSSGVPIAMGSTKMWSDVNRAASQRFGIIKGLITMKLGRELPPLMKMVNSLTKNSSKVKSGIGQMLIKDRRPRSSS